jgi:chromosome segregation ATPase
MDDSPKGSILTTPSTPSKSSPLISEGVKTVLIFVLLIAVAILFYVSYSVRQSNTADLAKMSERIDTLDKTGDARIAGLRAEINGEISATRQQVGSTKAELQKTAQQIQIEGQRTKTELNKALSTKAEATDVQAVKTEAESKIGQVSSEVGGVKNEVGAVKTDVGTVKTDLANTRRDLEGTQRELIDVRETLTAAVAKNATELEALRRKGERDYFEFTLPKKNQITKVEDIQLVLRKTDTKKGTFTVDIVVDDNKLEKKDRNINEPLQFLVGRNRVRYELVINWVQKDKAGGYLSIPKDKTLSSERAPRDQ